MTCTNKEQETCDVEKRTCERMLLWSSENEWRRKGSNSRIKTF